MNSSSNILLLSAVAFAAQLPKHSRNAGRALHLASLSPCTAATESRGPPRTVPSTQGPHVTAEALAYIFVFCYYIKYLLLEWFSLKIPSNTAIFNIKSLGTGNTLNVFFARWPGTPGTTKANVSTAAPRIPSSGPLLPSSLWDHRGLVPREVLRPCRGNNGFFKDAP